jgi:hypothetical protein
MKPYNSKYVFLVGNPASGKTSIYKQIKKLVNAQGMTIHRINDRKLFLSIISQDSQKLFHEVTPLGAVRITSPTFYNLLFHHINRAAIKAFGKADWIFVEITSSDYTATIPILDSHLLNQSSAVVILTNIEIAQERNSKRQEITNIVDEYRIPAEYLESCYTQNFDLQKLLPLFKQGIIIENNSSDKSMVNTLAEKVWHWLVEVENV